MDYEEIKQIVYTEIRKTGLLINYRKTKLLFGHKPWMYRIICGISVGKTDIKRSRKSKIKLKNAVFKNKASNVIAGLIQWNSCKKPNTYNQEYKIKQYYEITGKNRERSIRYRTIK